MNANECVQHLFECCDDDLGDAILKGYRTAVHSTENDLLVIMKRLAVIPVALCARRADLLVTRQDHGESTRAFITNITGKAATYAYTMKCSATTCGHINDYTDLFVKGILISGLADAEIKRKVISWSEVDSKSVEEVVSFIENEEMARDAMATHPVATAAVSTYKSNEKKGTTPKTLIACLTCNTMTERFVWNKRQGKTIEVSQCLPCMVDTAGRRLTLRRRNHQKTKIGITTRPNRTRLERYSSVQSLKRLLSRRNVRHFERSPIAQRGGKLQGKISTQPLYRWLVLQPFNQSNMSYWTITYSILMLVGREQSQ